MWIMKHRICQSIGRLGDESTRVPYRSTKRQHGTFTPANLSNHWADRSAVLPMLYQVVHLLLNMIHRPLLPLDFRNTMLKIVDLKVPHVHRRDEQWRVGE